MLAVTASIPPAIDLFAVLGLPRGFDIDPALLRRRYLALSRDTHPDLAREGAAATEVARRSARLNDAKRVLDNPVLRAEHLLELAGGENSALNKTVPPDVLANTLDLRDELDAARIAADQVAVERIRVAVTQARDGRLAEIAQLARLLPGDAQLRTRLRVELNSLKYQQKILEQIAGVVES